MNENGRIEFKKKYIKKVKKKDRLKVCYTNCQGRTSGLFRTENDRSFYRSFARSHYLLGWL